MTLRKPLQVLLIDDSNDDNFFHQRAIKKSGIEATTNVFVYADEALTYLEELAQRKAASDPPDLILLDINMPRMTGWEFLDAYQRLPKNITEAVLVVMLSTSPDPRDKDKANENPLVAEYSSKPLTPDTFTELVSRYFDSNEN